MDTKRLLCHDIGQFKITEYLLAPFLGLFLMGCGNGSGEAKPPRKSPEVTNARYERVQVAIDGKPIDADSKIIIGHDFLVTVSFRRLHVWPNMNNSESHILALVMEQIREHEVTRRTPSLNWVSEKEGVLTFSGKVEALPEPGTYGFWIQEAVTTETLGLERYLLFATNLRNVNP